jgi:hypothetical protein
MPRFLALVFACALCASAALAQLRTLPADAKRGWIRPVAQMDVEIDGRKMQLSPGAQIRDANNLLIVPNSLPAAGALAKYLLDASNMVYRVWILSPQEAAQPDPKK